MARNDSTESAKGPGSPEPANSRSAPPKFDTPKSTTAESATSKPEVPYRPLAHGIRSMDGDPYAPYYQGEPLLLESEHYPKPSSKTFSEQVQATLDEREKQARQEEQEKK